MSLCLTVLLSLLPLLLPGAVPFSRYSSFDNLGGKTTMMQVRSIAQDSDGMIWFGTSKGLFSYDGYDVRGHSSGEKEGVVSCLLQQNDTLFVGGENKVLLFSIPDNKFLPDKTISLDSDPRAMIVHDGRILIGTESGLYLRNGTATTLLGKSGATGRPTTYGMADEGDYVYVGSENGLWKYSPDGDRFEILRAAILTSAVIYDKARGCIWAGTSTALLKIDDETGEITSIGNFPVIKSFALDNDGNLIIGTDSGLYIYDGKDSRRITHDAQDDHSLSGDVIWALLKDKDGNIWIGSDNGLSLSVQDEPVTEVMLHSITHSRLGNKISSIQMDNGGDIWLGGNHGIIQISGYGTASQDVIWYMMDSQSHPIPHNHVSGLFKDKDGRIFAQSDAGILYFDSAAGKFRDITFSGEINRSRWVYNMDQDKDGNYWVATYSGLYKVSGDYDFSGPTVTPLMGVQEEDGLSSGKLSKIEIDGSGRIWVLTHEESVDTVDPATGHASEFLLEGSAEKLHVADIQKDSDGNIWLATADRVIKYNPSDGHAETATFRLSPVETYDMAEAKGRIWLATSYGLFSVVKKTMELRHTGITESYRTVFYDKGNDRILLGSSDKVAIISPDKLLLPSRDEVRITYASANGGTPLDYRKIRSGHITLGIRQNDLTIHVSDMNYSNGQYSVLSYLCEGLDNNWVTLPPNSNSIQLINLSPGKYRLYLSGSHVFGDNLAKTPALVFRINAPWYFSKAMVALYIVILLAVITITFREREERRKYEEEKRQSKAKLAFLTDIAHELKTPLSLIMAPLGKMMTESRSDEDKNMLRIMHSNALKLSSMINRSIDIYRGGGLPVSVTNTDIELVDFVRSIFNTYKEDQEYIGREFVFDCNREALYVSTDVQKLESILTNLISNACKYTPSGGSILLHMDYTDGQLTVKISDTGVGIPENEIPFIFQRFYQSSRTAPSDKTGTGVGLSIVKTYIDLMGGTIDVASGEIGTTFTVRLPLSELHVPEHKDSGAEPQAGKENLPLIAIVEDNLAVSDMLCSILGDEYRCVRTFNGRSGLKLCQESLPDLIIADVMMPVMDGLTMCKKIREFQPLEATPVILLTAKHDPDLEYKSAVLGIDAFIPKPFEPEMLLARIRQLTAKKSALAKQVRIEAIKTPEKKGEMSQDEKFLMEATKVIEDMIDDPNFSVSLLSEKMKTSTKQLYRKIKQLTGQSPVEYIRSIRMKKAALLFQSGRFTVTEVMYMVGFTNASYFSSCFSKEFDVSPREYISSNRKSA